MVSQIIFLREFLVVFYGNEISIGIILASWLIWGSFGSWFLGRYSDRVQSKDFLFSFCQFFLAFILPATIFAIRSSKNFMAISTGEIVGYYPMAAASFLILAPSCAVWSQVIFCRSENRHGKVTRMSMSSSAEMPQSCKKRASGPSSLRVLHDRRHNGRAQ